MSQINAAFIGLGTMGYPMAGHLAEAGLSMTVYNRTAAKAQGLVDAVRGAAQRAGPPAPPSGRDRSSPRPTL